MFATCHLGQESGVSGPSATIEVPDERPGQIEAAVDWSTGQTGHPWDYLTVEIYATREDAFCGRPIDTFEV